MIAATTRSRCRIPSARGGRPIAERNQLGTSRGSPTMLVETLTRLKINGRRRRGIRRLIRSHRPDHAQAPPLLAAGHELGPYRLLEWLGRGAEGDVWKAVRLEPVEELVALKILKPSLASNPARMAQFRREAERGTGWSARRCSRSTS